MISEKLLGEIDRGRLGLNHGISMGLPKLESIIDGVSRETYTLILSNSGAGEIIIFQTWRFYNFYILLFR